MKNLTKIFMAVVAGMFAFACTTDTTEDLGLQVGGANGAIVELSLSLEESRTQLGEKVDGLYPVYWSAGDKISVNGVESGEAIINQSNPASATFAVAEATTYAVAYPAAPQGQVLFTEKQSHVAAGNTFASGVSTMYGYGESANNIQLNHLTGVLKIGIKGEAILSKAQISTIDRAPIAGAFGIDFQTGELTATPASKKVIEYSFGEGLQLSGEAQYIHVAVPAGEYDELYITLYEKGNSGNIMYATVKAGESKPLTAGNVREFTTPVTYIPNAKLYVIDSVEQLVAFKAAVEAEGGLNMDAIFTEDIDMTGVEWTPIEGYAGTVNGNGYAIKNLTAPLFGDTNASFKGLHIENANITYSDRYIAGAMACTITATDTVSPVVENCSLSGTITVNNTAAASHVRYGTLVGVTLGVKINNCVNNATFTITKPYGEGSAKDVSIGGVIGWIREFTKSDATVLYSELNNSVNNGKISYEDATTSVSNLYVGGLTSSSAADNKGTMMCNNTNNGEVAVLCNCGTIRLGGMAGYAKGTAVEADRQGDKNINNGKVVIKNGTNITGTVFMGGIIGNSVVFSYSNCHNYGTIEIEEGAITKTTEVGGVNGRALSDGDKDNAFVIHDCTNNAPINVLGSSPTNDAGSFRVGGITAYTQGDVRRVTNNKEGVITIGGVRNTNGKVAAAGSPKTGDYVVAGVCGYKTIDTMSDCTNHADIIMSGTINEINTSKVSEFKVVGIVGYTSKNGSNYVSDGTIKLTGTFNVEMMLGGSYGLHYNTISGSNPGDEHSSTKFEVSGTCNKGLVIGGVVAFTYVKCSQLEYNGEINITKDAVISDHCYIGGCVGKLMGDTTSPSGVYCQVATNNGPITVDGTFNGTFNVGGVIGYATTVTDGKVYALSNLANTAAITFGTDGSVPSNNMYIAGCVGHAEATVTTATNSGAITVNGSSTGGNSYIAGCVADATKTLSGLTNSAPIFCDGTMKSARLGGVAGYAGIIQNSTNTGSVTFTGSASTDSHCYGIAYYSTTMSGCVNGSADDATLGKLEYNSTNGKAVYLAGLSRQCITKSENNTNYGNLYMNGPANATAYIGGMHSTGVDNATYVSARIGCHNYGNIYINADVAPTANNNCFIGGFTYRNNNAFSFEDCHNHGDIILKEGITVGNAIRMGGFIGTMETGTNVTFDRCSNSGDIIVNEGVVCGNTTANSTGYIRIGGFVGNQSAGTITVNGYLKNTGKMEVAGESKHAQNMSVGGLFGHAATAFVDGSDAVLINEGEVVFSGIIKNGIRVGGIIGSTSKTHPAAVSFVNTGNVTCTGTFGSASHGAYIGGVFGQISTNQANAKNFGTVTGYNYTGVGSITGTHYAAGTIELSNCAAGGKIYCYTESDVDASGDSVTYPMPGDLTAANWYKHFYGAEVEESVLTAAGCSRLTEKPSTEIPAPAEPEVTE